MSQLFSKPRLFCPGPTPVPDSVRQAMARSDVYHRSPEFCATFVRCREMLREFFGSAQLPLLLASSGSGAMEAAVTNLTQEEDEVAVVSAGKFGERWAALNRSYANKVHTLEIPYGEAPTPEQVEKLIKDNPGTKALFLQANETSTGVYFPLEEIIPRLRETYSGLIVVDAVSGLVAHQMKMDAWEIDAVVSGSQKGFGLPPGLAFICLSARAEGMLSSRSRYYFDLGEELKGQASGKSAFTCPASLVLGLEAALDELKAIGVEPLAAHHRRLAEATRAAGEAIGLRCFAKRNHSNALSAFEIPDGVDGKQLVKAAYEQDRITFAGGQGQMSGKIVRLAHLGFVGRLDLLAGIAGLEFALRSCGYDFESGSGLAAASLILYT